MIMVAVNVLVTSLLIANVEIVSVSPVENFVSNITLTTFAFSITKIVL